MSPWAPPIDAKWVKIAFLCRRRTQSGPRTTYLQGIPGASHVQSPHCRPGTSPAPSLPSVCHREGVCQASLVPQEAEKFPVSSHQVKSSGRAQGACSRRVAEPWKGVWPAAPTNAGVASRAGGACLLKSWAGVGLGETSPLPTSCLPSIPSGLGEILSDGSWVLRDPGCIQ